MDEKLNAVLEFCKIMTGSIMSNERILDEYIKLNHFKKKLLYDKGKRVLKIHTGPFDITKPIIAIEYGLISAEYNVDPGVVFLATIKKAKRI